MPNPGEGGRRKAEGGGGGRRKAEGWEEGEREKEGRGVGVGEGRLRGVEGRQRGWEERMQMRNVGEMECCLI